MEFKTRFEVDDFVYFYSNNKTHMYNTDGYLEPHGMFIQQGQIKKIRIDYMKHNDKRLMPFIIYKVRICDNVIEDVHENFMASDVDELAEQSKNYFISEVVPEETQKS